MKITALVENTTHADYKTAHGLSLYMETENHKLLFDLGPDDTMFVNAEKKGIDLAAVDTVVLSHGHGDHGGALEKFLEVNRTARIYVQEKAFEPHYSDRGLGKVSISLNADLKDHPQIVLLKGDHHIDEELFLFTVSDTQKCHSTANDTLYDQQGQDTFAHEQNLIITETRDFGKGPVKTTSLILGCGHCGVVNILEKAKEYKPVVCVGGYHLMRPATKTCVAKELLDEIAKELKQYPETEFFTCHCTGQEAYEYLAEKLPNMYYLSCGEDIFL